MKIFIPLCDEMLDQDMDLGALVPFQFGVPSVSQVTASAHVPSEASAKPETQSMNSRSSSPGLTPNSSALPALSSKTYRAGPVLG